jgi:hypothetical protein
MKLKILFRLLKGISEIDFVLSGNNLASRASKNSWFTSLIDKCLKKTTSIQFTETLNIKQFETKHFNLSFCCSND